MSQSEQQSIGSTQTYIPIDFIKFCDTDVQKLENSSSQAVFKKFNRKRKPNWIRSQLNKQECQYKVSHNIHHNRNKEANHKNIRYPFSNVKRVSGHNGKSNGQSISQK